MDFGCTLLSVAFFRNHRDAANAKQSHVCSAEAFFCVRVAVKPIRSVSACQIIGKTRSLIQLYSVQPFIVVLSTVKNTPNSPHWHSGQVDLTNGTEKLTEKKEVLRPTVTTKVLS